MAPLRSPSRPLLDDPLPLGPDDPVDGRSPADAFPFHRSPSSGVGWMTDRWPWLAISTVRLAGGLLALVVSAMAGWWLIRPAPAPVETTLPMASAPETTATGTGADPAGSTPAVGAAASTTVPADLVVQAAGSVNRPGVYRLAADARVDDLVRAAGGLLADADGDRVNLAAPLADGARVWIPAQGETDVPEVVAGGAGGGSPPGGASGGGPGPAATPQVIDLNTATAEQLDTLPGVGPATAAAILAFRSEHGPFSSVDDLLEVRGIGDAKLEQIRPLARV